MITSLKRLLKKHKTIYQIVALIYRYLMYLRWRLWVFAQKIQRKSDFKTNVRDYENVYLDLNDYRSYMIVKSNGTQKEKIDIWENLIKEFSPECILDMGANYGEFSLVARANKNIKYILFEPNQDVTKCLQKTFSECNNLRIMNSAVSYETVDQDFYFNKIMSGSSSLIPMKSANDRWNPFVRKKYCYSRKVQPSNPITILKSEPHSKVMAKLDIEGYEPNILQPFLEYLDTQNISYIILVEYSYRTLERNQAHTPESFFKTLLAKNALRVYGDKLVELKQFNFEKIKEEKPTFDVIVSSEPLRV